MNADPVMELARRIIEVAAPDEVPLFEALATAGRPRSRRDDALGFGLYEVGSTLTPIALYVAAKVVDVLLEHTITKGGTTARIRVHRWWSRAKPSIVEASSAVILQATPDRLDGLRAQLVADLTQHGVPPELAGQLSADTVTAILRWRHE